MALKKDDSGRRSVQVEVEVPGTPEEVWQAIATGPGVSSWFVPSTVEGRVGGKVTASYGPGMESVAIVTEWDPPRKFVANSQDDPNAPTMATEWSVEARAGGVCIVRVVHSLFASTDDWNGQLEGAESGWPGFFRILRLYLAHFRGQRSALMQWMAMPTCTEAEAWDKITTSLGLKGVSAGQRWAAPMDVPSLGGVVEPADHYPYHAVLRVDRPASGVADLGAANCGGSVIVTISFYLYGDQVAGVADREKPLWQAWVDRLFPMPTEPDKSE